MCSLCLAHSGGQIDDGFIVGFPEIVDDSFELCMLIFQLNLTGRFLAGVASGDSAFVR